MPQPTNDTTGTLDKPDKKKDITLLHWGISLAEALKQIAALEPGCSVAELCEDCACNVARALARDALQWMRGGES